MDKLLYQFKVIAESGSLIHAAEVLHVSQPALTQNIKKLEQRYEAKLLIRSRHGTSLTPYGQVLYDHAQGMDNLHKQAIEKINELKERKEHSLLIGTGHVFWELGLKNLLGEYQEAHPDASMHVEFGNNLTLLDRVLCGHLEIFFGHEILGLSSKSDLQFVPILESERAWFVRSTHPLAHEVIAEKDMTPYPILKVTAHDPRYMKYIENVDENPVEQKRRETVHRRCVSTNSITAGIELLQFQDAILGFPMEYKDYMARFDIVPLTFDRPPMMELMGAYYQKRSLHQGVKELLDSVQKEFQ